MTPFPSTNICSDLTVAEFVGCHELSVVICVWTSYGFNALVVAVGIDTSAIARTNFGRVTVAFVDVGASEVDPVVPATQASCKNFSALKMNTEKDDARQSSRRCNYNSLTLLDKAIMFSSFSLK